MFTGARMDWQLVASYFTVKSTDFFAVHKKQDIAAPIEALKKSIALEIKAVLC